MAQYWLRSGCHNVHHHGGLIRRVLVLLPDEAAIRQLGAAPNVLDPGRRGVGFRVEDVVDPLRSQTLPSDWAPSGRKAGGSESEVDRAFIHSTFQSANLSSDMSRVERLEFLGLLGSASLSRLMYTA
jgi:hypothetical protein